MSHNKAFDYLANMNKLEQVGYSEEWTLSEDFDSSAPQMAPFYSSPFEVFSKEFLNDMKLLAKEIRSKKRCFITEIIAVGSSDQQMAAACICI